MHLFGDLRFLADADVSRPAPGRRDGGCFGGRAGTPLTDGPGSGFFPGRAPIDAYGGGGFRFADMSHRGSILCLPSGILAWDPPVPLTEASLAPVFAEADEIELLLVGTGRLPVPLPESVRWALRSRKIGAESMATGAAVRTYNILLGEGRRVAAALTAID